MKLEKKIEIYQWLLPLLLRLPKAALDAVLNCHLQEWTTVSNERN